MEQFIFDERNGLWYELCGDYYLPCLETPESPRVGKFGRLRSTFLREYRGVIYTGMLFSGKLNAHLEEIDRQAYHLRTENNFQFFLKGRNNPPGLLP